MIDILGFKCPYCKTNAGMLATGYLVWLCLLCGNTFTIGDDDGEDRDNDD